MGLYVGYEEKEGRDRVLVVLVAWADTCEEASGFYELSERKEVRAYCLLDYVGWPRAQLNPFPRRYLPTVENMSGRLLTATGAVRDC